VPSRSTWNVPTATPCRTIGAVIALPSRECGCAANSHGSWHELAGNVLPESAGDCAHVDRGRSGKRTLAKLNAFDLVVTVALGSTLSSILLQESIALAEGLTALGLLITAQFLVTFVSVRSSRFASVVRSEPALLAKDGRALESAMRRARITQDEALSAIRANGGNDMNDVDMLVLESDGTISVRLRG